MENTNEITIPKTKYSRLKLIIRIIIAFIISSVVIYFIFDSITSTPEKEYAIKNSQNLKNILKDPDSLKLYEDVLVISDSENFYTYIEYGAKNGFGGITRDIAIYAEYKYVGTLEEAEKNIGNNSRELSLASVAYNSYKLDLYGNDMSSFIKGYKFIKKEMIMRKLK